MLTASLHAIMSATILEKTRTELAARVEKIVLSTPVYDIHTHLYDSAFGELLLWGIDDLLVYHYLVSEAFRYLDMPYDKFWAQSKTEQADLIWDALFVKHSPISEACRGVLTTLNLLGLDVKKRDLGALRRWFSNRKADDFVSRCMELAKVERICMTNSPFDELERPVWERGFRRDERFVAALRIDPLLVAWLETAPQLTEQGYVNGPGLSRENIGGVRRFLADWTRKIDAQYLMVSLPPSFRFPENSFCAQLIEQAVLPHCREFGLPFAMMMGVKRGVNPQLKMAGDGVGRSKLAALQALCSSFPDNKFLVTVLSRENQSELCVLARKFRNLHIFGCWWFTNIPSVVEEMTRMRLELLGLSVTAQHSDARVLDQLIYKWDHSRRIIASVLTEKYASLCETGWELADSDIERDVNDLFGGAFRRFCGR